MSFSSGLRGKKVLFFAEAVTLAHIARPAVLAGLADAAGFDVVLARDPRYSSLFPDLCYRQRDLYSISSADFLAALAKGAPLYSAAVLERYVEEDLRIIDSEAPDVVVGDFRLSLAVSARLRNIPYITISNAYWSPYAKLSYTIPEHPLTGVFGVTVAERLFKLARSSSPSGSSAVAPSPGTGAGVG
jgi:UDP:flavonoid glycosyltransferase YjiC (YdhE family)